MAGNKQADGAFKEQLNSYANGVRDQALQLKILSAVKLADHGSDAAAPKVLQRKKISTFFFKKKTFLSGQDNYEWTTSCESDERTPQESRRAQEAALCRSIAAPHCCHISPGSSNCRNRQSVYCKKIKSNDERGQCIK